MFALMLFLTGCISNPGSLSDGSGTETPNRRDIFAKWKVTDPNARFTSIELTDDEVYIVIEREESAEADHPARETLKFHTGKYTVSEDSVEVYLIDFGILQIDPSSGEKSAAVKLQLEPRLAFPNHDIYEFNAEKAVEIASSTKTDLICRNWKFVRFLLNGVLWEPWEEPEAWPTWEFPQSKPEITNLFSKAGTYLQTLTVDGAQTLTVLGEWKWVDENENAFYHTDWRAGNWQEDAVNVTLTETTFAITEVFNNGDILITEFEFF